MQPGVVFYGAQHSTGFIYLIAHTKHQIQLHIRALRNIHCTHYFRNIKCFVIYIFHDAVFFFFDANKFISTRCLYALQLR